VSGFLEAISLLWIARRIATELGYEDTDCYMCKENLCEVIILRVPHKKVYWLQVHRDLKLIDGVYQ